MAVENASIDGSEESSLSNIMTFVDLDIILAHQGVAASLNNSSNLLSICIIHLGSGPAAWHEASAWKELANGGLSLHLEVRASVFRNDLSLVLSS